MKAIPTTISSRRWQERWEASPSGGAYIMDPQMEFGYPSARYYDTLLQGYRDCGLDPEVLRQAVLDSGEQTRQPEYGGVKLC